MSDNEYPVGDVCSPCASYEEAKQRIRPVGLLRCEPFKLIKGGLMGGLMSKDSEPDQLGRKCTGCNGKGKFQLLGPVQNCEVCGGSGVEIIGKTVGAAEKLRVLDRRQYGQQVRIANDGVGFVFDRALVGTVTGAKDRNPGTVLYEWLEAEGWVGVFVLTDLFDYRSGSVVHFERSHSTPAELSS